MEQLIKKLNVTLRGWANYHRHVVSSKVFARVDTYVYEQLWRMLHRRHTDKSKGWLIRKYWTATGKKWIFSVKNKHRGKTHVCQVLRISSIGVKRHIKIKADANPYMPEYSRYYWERKHKRDAKFMSQLSAREMRRAVNK